MRQFRTALVLCAIVALSLGAFSRLRAETARPNSGGVLASLTQAGDWATSHLSPLGKVRVPDLRRLFGRRQTTAQSPTDGTGTPAPSVHTDKADYQPGQNVIITGSGWQPLETVSLLLHEDPQQEDHGDLTYYAVANEAGNIRNDEFFVDYHDLGIGFVLTATGQSSGLIAYTTFTDSAASVNLDDCANGPLTSPVPCVDPAPPGGPDDPWTNGNLVPSKAHYLEGDSVPFRARLSDLTVGDPVTGPFHTLTLAWDTTKGGKHAFDYLTNFDRTETTADPCGPNVSGCLLAGPKTLLSVPIDPNVSGGGVTQIPGVFTMFNGHLISASAYTLTGSYAGDSTTFITLTFSADTTNPVLAWGAHVSTRLDWSASAISINGSSYHLAVGNLDGSGGSQDHQISADTVIFPGSITIIKDATPNGSTSFGFTASPTPLANFSLVDDGTSANTVVFSNITDFQAYSVAETVPSLWTLTGIVCSVTSPNGGKQTVTSPSVSIDLKEGENVTCTFANTRDTGKLKLSKALTGGPSGYTGPFTIAYDCTDGTDHDGSVTIDSGSSMTISGIPTGTSCTVSETVPTAPTGYTFGTPTFSPSATVTIATKDATVEVTTSNTLTRDTGSLKLSKALTGGPAGYTGPFTIAYDCTDGTAHDGSVTIASGSSQTISGIPTGTSCTVSETVPTAPTGYTFGTPTFSPSATVTIATKDATVEVTTNNTLTQDTGSLKLSKALTGGPAGYTGPFTIAYDCSDGTAHDGTATVNSGSSQTISGIPTGTSCTVSETVPTAPTGYTFGTPTFSPSATVTIATKDATVEVTTSNTLTRDTGSLKLSKALTGGPAGYTGPFTIAYDCTDGTAHDGSVTIASGSSQTISGIPTGASCTVSETVPTAPTGYTFGTPTFSPSATVTIATKDATVEVTTNNTLTRDTGSLKLSKALTGGPAGYTGPFTIAYDCSDGTAHDGSATVNSGSSQTISGIPTGTSCTVSETVPTAPTGYTFGTPTFSPSATVTIATKDAAVEVTTTNTLTQDTGSLKLSKALTGGPAGYTGPFTIAYDCTDGTTHDGSVTIASGSSQTISGIPTGTSCTVSETVPTAPTGYTFGTPTFSPSATVTIATKDATVEVTTNNTLSRDTGSLKLSKALTGGPAGYTGPFTIAYDCSDGIAHDGSATVNSGSSQTISGIPTGTSCTVSETPPSAPTGYTFGTPTFSPSATVMIATKNATVEVTTNNTLIRDTGSLKLSKALTGGPAAYTGPFTIAYDCNDGTAHDGSATVNSGSSQTISGIPTGTSCTVSETPPSAPTGYTFGAPTFNPSGTVAIAKDTTVEVTTNNTLTRDLGNLQILKTLSNPDGASVPASFSVNYNCGTGYTGSVSVAPGSPATVNGIPTGTTCSVAEVAPAAIANFTWGPITYTPASVVVSTKGGTFSITVGNSITRDRGTIIIKKITKPANTGSFGFTTTSTGTGSGYIGFSLAGGAQNSQTLVTGTYTVKESTQLGWTLTGLGGDPNTPYNCIVAGSGGSTGTGDLNTQTATITLKKGDTVTCTFENTGSGATRTQGFWATHTPLANSAWFGGTAFGHTFPGAAGTAGIGDATLCGRPIDTLEKLMGGFWSDISKTTDNKKRSALDQARMQLLQQLLSAELNASAFGSVPAGGSGQFAAWEAAYCGANQTAIQNALQGAASFNNAGDGATFTPGTSADSKNARAIANYLFWDILP